MLLACLGAVFTSAGVGEIISKGVSAVVPAGNVNVGIIIYAVGMVIFTAIMGNAFAAITVMTVGIGVPFVFSLGADPALVGMVALTCGFCGTLLTPILPLKQSKNYLLKLQELKLLKLRCQLFLALVVKKWLKQLKPINQIW